MAAPKVTVGIPVFNGEKWLAQTIVSVIEQSYEDVVVVVSDNASTDDSWTIAQDFAQRDERIRCYKNSSNLGVFRNLDRVFELSTTPYFKWCCVGDLLERSFLEQAVNVLENKPEVMLVYAKTGFIGDQANCEKIKDIDVSLELPDPVGRYRSYLSSYGLNSPFHGVVRSSALSRTSLNKAFQGSDQCLIAALLLQGPFVRLPEELLLRRIERDTATATKSSQELDEFFGAQAETARRRSGWKLEKQLFLDVVGTPVELNAKFKIMLYLLRRLYWRRRSLFGG